MEIACVIEGDGEEDALPLLIRRIVTEIDPGLYIHVPRPVRQPRGRLKMPQHLDRAIGVAVGKFRSVGAVLTVVDADDDCPVVLASNLLEAAQTGYSHIPMAVVIANREYEAWFLAAAQSLQGHRGLRDDLTAPADCEAIRDAKGWLKNRATGRERYDPIDHQASFSARIDLGQARQSSRSFRKLDKEVRRLVEALQAAQS